MKSFDTVIIGGGIGGLMAAYRLRLNAPEMTIAIVERGNELSKRVCPAGKNSTCIHCKICSITSGFAGAGAFFDLPYRSSILKNGEVSRLQTQRKNCNNGIVLEAGSHRSRH